MRNLIGPSVAPRRKTVAPAIETAIIATLKNHDRNYREARRQRIEAVAHARSVGLTNQAIGDALGITEKAVRDTIRKAAGGE